MSAHINLNPSVNLNRLALPQDRVHVGPKDLTKKCGCPDDTHTKVMQVFRLEHFQRVIEEAQKMGNNRALRPDTKNAWHCSECGQECDDESPRDFRQLPYAGYSMFGGGYTIDHDAGEVLHGRRESDLVSLSVSARNNRCVRLHLKSTKGSFLLSARADDPPAAFGPAHHVSAQRCGQFEVNVYLTPGSELWKAKQLFLCCMKDTHDNLEEQPFRAKESAIALNYRKISRLKKFVSVQLICRDGQVVQGNSGILSIWSPVFRAMFEDTDSLEAQKNEVHLHDCEEDTVRAFVNYLNGEVVTKDTLDKHGFELYQMSHKYQVEDLTKSTEIIVAKSINLENYVHLLRWAETYGSSLIKNAIIDFVRRRKSNILDSAAMKSFIQSDPRAQVLEMLVRSK